MDWQGWFTIAVVVVILVSMILEVASPDLIMMAGLLTLAAVGVLDPSEVFVGFANQAVMTIGALFVLAAALRNTGAMEATLGRIFGRTRSEFGGLLRMCPTIAVFSGVMNNTTIVAMMTPVVIDWARRARISPSRVLIPLSYATILGGFLTMIGTSVILTVAGLMTDAKMEPMGFFELLPLGVPITVVGVLYLLFVAPHLLPNRKEPTEDFSEQQRNYTAAMAVESQCSLVGKSVEAAGLRHLPGLFLVEIERSEHIVSPVSPDEIIQSKDRLVFAGVVSTIADLQRIQGLVPVADLDGSSEAPAAQDPSHRLIEAVVSHSSPLVHQSIREANFRTVYDAAVIAVHRNGEQVPGKIGEIVVQPGDTLLLRSGPGFLRAHANSRDFYLVSELPDSEAPRYDRAWVSIGVLLGVIALASTGILPPAIAAWLAAGALIVTRCITITAARRSIELPVLVVIAAGFGIAAAMTKTGAATWIASYLVSFAGESSPMLGLALIYLLTMTLSETLNHNASAAIMFPISIAVATQLGVDPRSFVMVIAVAAGCAFASPVAYQTHLIVYGPGGYRFSDFIRVGIPLNLICAAIVLTLAPHIWPF